MSKATIVERPNLLPQKCSLCSAGSRDRYYVDMDLSIDRYGRVYLCSVCVRELAHLCGYVSSRELSVALKKNHIYLDKVNELQLKVRELEHVVDSLRRIDGELVSVGVSDDEILSKSDGEKRRATSKLTKSGSGSKSTSLPKTARLFESL